MADKTDRRYGYTDPRQDHPGGLSPGGLVNIDGVWQVPAARGTAAPPPVSPMTGSGRAGGEHRPMAPWQRRLGGAFLASMGVACTAWTWYTALTEGTYYRWASIFFPYGCVLGLGLILFPGYRDERIARGEDISGMRGLQLLTPRWWAVMAVGFIAGLANYLLLASM
jgi:hypothetical protein